MLIYKKLFNEETAEEQYRIIKPKHKNTDKTILLKEITKLRLHDPEPKPFYRIPANISQELHKNIKNKEFLEKLMYSMTEHLNIDGHFIKLYVHDNTNANYSGAFTNSKYTGVSITLQIQDYYTVNVVAAILAHEIMHMYLHYKGIEEQVPKLNEILTDTAAVYYGFGEYMYIGYEYIKTNSDNLQKVGYLSPEDIQFIINELY